MAELMLHSDTLPAGTTTLGSALNVKYANMLRVTAGDSNIKLQQVALYLGFLTSNCTITIYLYSDNGGEPGSSIDTLASKTFTVADTLGWYAIYDSVTGKSLTAGTDYWIVTKVSGADGITSKVPTDTQAVSDVGYLSTYTLAYAYSPLAESWTGVGSVTTPPFRYSGVENSAAVPEKATAPYPEHEQDKVTNGIAFPLSWEDGGYGEDNEATAYDLYIGSGLGGADYLAVEDGSYVDGVGVFDIPENLHYLMGDIDVSYLNELTTYEWYIVSKNDAGETEGDTWEFDTSGVRYLGTAYEPTPGDD